MTLLLNSTKQVNLKIIQSSSLPSIGLPLSCVGIFLTWLSRLGQFKNNSIIWLKNFEDEVEKKIEIDRKKTSRPYFFSIPGLKLNRVGVILIWPIDLVNSKATRLTSKKSMMMKLIKKMKLIEKTFRFNFLLNWV